MTDKPTQRPNPEEVEIPKELHYLFDNLKKACLKNDENLILENLIKIQYCIPHEEDRKLLDFSETPNPAIWINGIINGLSEVKARADFQRLGPNIKHRLNSIIAVAEQRLNLMRTLEMPMF